ncbi:MAG: TonB-dependent receptor plug domain-containing protein, partial [Kordiimonadaceae bacterium]|nr:TonB-dependent receptor plug domain-containing protein [Kordiimonadaceae bacterium]
MGQTNKLAAILMTTVFSFNQLTYAQKVETTEDGSIVTYEKDYFDKFSAVTLLDMILIIPGGKEIIDKNQNQFRGNGANSQGDRGFGSGGDQILIDGKRLAGKSNNIDDTLSRISATQIEKIELIRGAASGLDVQSQGLVINITMAEGGDTATTFWQVSGKYTFNNDFKPEFLVSRSGKLRGLDYSVSVARENGGFFYLREEQAFDADDVKTSDQDVDAGFEWKNLKFNSNVSYSFENGGDLRLNGLFEPGGREGYEIRTKTTNVINPVTRLTDEDSDKWEFGGDYSRSLGELGNLKALFVINRDKGDEIVNLTKGSGGGLFEFANEHTIENKSEKIFRASLTKGIGSKQFLELGGEVAINTFDKSFLNNERRNVLDVDITAVVTDPFIIANSDDVKIKENRYEIFANHTYN